MDQIELYPFSYFDLIRRKWARARYRATVDEMAERYAAFRIEGAPEIRQGPADTLNFMYGPSLQ